MKITATTSNATLLSLVSLGDKSIIESVLTQNSINSVATVLIQNRSEHNMYVELGKAADTDSMLVEKGTSITLYKVSLPSINIISNNATCVGSILVSNP